MLRHADRAATRGAHHQDAALSGFVQVDIVYADAGPADHAQAGRVIQQRWSYLRCAADDEGVRVRQLRMQRLLCCKYDVPAGLPQYFNSAIADLVRDNDFHDSSIPGKSREGAQRSLPLW